MVKLNVFLLIYLLTILINLTSTTHDETRKQYILHTLEYMLLFIGRSI